MDVRDRIIVGLDVDTLEEAEEIIQELRPYVGTFKLGSQILTALGVPAAVELVHGYDCKVFLDAKYHDIPSIVGAAVRNAARLGICMLDIHASSEMDAMLAARKNSGGTQVFAVTVLTSLSEELAFLTYGAPSRAQVLQFARNATLAGLDGIVCSGQELQMLSSRPELDLKFVVPGVRPEWYPTKDDQSLTISPWEGIKLGADMFVFARPILEPEICSRIEAAQRITAEIERAVKGS